MRFTITFYSFVIEVVIQAISVGFIGLECLLGLVGAVFFFSFDVPQSK